MMRSLRSLLAAALLLAAPATAAAADPAAPVVVELFTSQGCDSCPPADALLGELAARGDVLPLGFHVTYWDRLGWRDTLGAEAHTQRQHAYASQHGEARVYTPQMVIGGAVDAVGSDRRRVLAAIELVRERIAPVALAVEGAGDAARLRLPAGAGDGEATVWLVAFDRAHDVAIARGENAGRTVRYHNVVRDFEKLGIWTGGEPLDLPLSLGRLAAAGRDAAAVLVQRARDGVIVASSAALDLTTATD
jgi:hypothetical protein